VPRPGLVSINLALISMLIASLTEPTLTEHGGELPVPGQLRRPRLQLATQDLAAKLAGDDRG
jgi:hypothetical protein